MLATGPLHPDSVILLTSKYVCPANPSVLLQWLRPELACCKLVACKIYIQHQATWVLIARFCFPGIFNDSFKSVCIRFLIQGSAVQLSKDFKGSNWFCLENYKASLVI